MIHPPVVADERFQRAMRRRQAARHTRTAQAVLIAGLAGLGTRDLWVLAWLAAVVLTGVLESLTTRAAQADPDAAPRALACQALSAGAFATLGLILCRGSAEIGLLGAMLVLCAAILGNAVQASASRKVAYALVGPPATALVASPLWVGLTGRLPLSETLLLAAAGVAYVAYVVGLTRSTHAHSEALRHARLAAEDGARRWRMVFDHSVAARICFDASSLYAVLQARSHDRTCLGDVLRAEGLSLEVLRRHVRLIEANESAQSLLGRKLTRAHLAPDFLEGFCSALNEMDEFGTLPGFETQIVLEGGETMEIEAHYRLSAGPGTPWKLCLVTYVDITERKRVARAREEARRAAEEANRAKSDFLTVMSHEIRTPLNGVLGMAQALDMGPLSVEQRDRVRVIKESGGALMALLDDLLDLSRIDAGRLELESHDFDLRAEMEAAHAAFAADAAKKKLAFDLEIDPNVGGLWRGDSARVRQVASNLISNAVKFTRKGRVTVRLTKSGSGVQLEVSDTGIGIAPDRVTRIFDKFVQADTSATRAHGGTGLGLALCQEICRAMGGAITVGSAPGQGSTFSVELPLRHVERAAPPVEPMTFEEADGPMRVLAAEDNPVNRMVLKALLGQFDLEPTIVDNGAEAVRAWETAHWDLILMDVQMPVMDGPTATMTIRAREGMTGRQRTPILAVTANTLAHQVASYRAAGMDGVVGKPLNVTELFSAMIAAVGADEEPANLRVVR